MSLRINTNVAALNAYNNLNTNQNNLESAFEQLSSGMRINSAADDASGLAISQGLTTQINGLTQAVSNAGDATNVAQIADGALGTVQNILQRMHTLAVEAANSGAQDTSSTGDIQQEITSLNSELDNISNNTTFGGTQLLAGTATGGVFTSGTAATFTFQVGATSASADQISLTLSASDSHSLGVNAISVTTSAGALAAMSSIETAIQTVSTERGNIGAVENQLSYTTDNLNTAVTNVTSARSNLTDADLATEVTSMTQSQILVSAATSVLSQANSAPQAILKLLQ